MEFRREKVLHESYGHTAEEGEKGVQRQLKKAGGVRNLPFPQICIILSNVFSKSVNESTREALFRLIILARDKECGNAKGVVKSESN